MAIITGLRLSWSNIIFLLVGDFNFTHVNLCSEDGILYAVFFTVVTTHRLEGTGLPRHRRRTANFFGCSLFVDDIRWFINHDNLSRVFLLLMLEILFLHNPSRVCELNTLLIWFADAVHLSRISEAALPHGIADDFHFVFLIFLNAKLHLGFSCNFREVHVDMSFKIRELIDSLLRDHLLNIHDMLFKLFDIYPSRIMNLCVRGDVTQSVKMTDGVVRVTNRQYW